MSEKLTAEEVLEKHRVMHLVPFPVRERLFPAIEEYAAHQIREIKEERDKAMEILKQANSILNISGYKIEPWSPFAEQLQTFLTSINKTNG